MKLGFASAILPDCSFERVIDIAAEFDLDCAEIMCWPAGLSERRYAGVTHIDVATLDESRAKRINEQLDTKGISISALGYYPNPLDSDLAQRAVYISHIKKVIDGAALLGVKIVNTFIGKDSAIPVRDNFNEFTRVWPEIIKYAEDKNVLIGIENCPMYFKDEWPGGKNLAVSPAVWREMFSVIDSKHFGLNYDPSHLAWQRMDYIKPIYEFKEKIFHFHIKDTLFYQDRYNDVGFFAAPLEYMEPKLPGMGEINWGRVISALRDIRYRGDAVIEVEDRAFEDTLEDRITSIRLSADYCRNFVR